MRIQVECRRRDGPSAEPYRFHLGGRQLHVAHILARDIAPEVRTFTVSVDDGRRFVLRHDVPEDYWTLERVLPAGARRAHS